MMGFDMPDIGLCVPFVNDDAYVEQLERQN